MRVPLATTFVFVTSILAGGVASATDLQPMLSPVHDSPVVVSVDDGMQTYVGTETELKGYASSLEGRICSYEWDFESDGVVDFRSPRPHATHVFASPGVYDVTLHATDTRGLSGSARVSVVVESGVGSPRVLPRPRIVPPASVAPAPSSADEGRTIYAILLTGSGYRWSPSLDFYELLVGDCAADPNNIFVLLADYGTPEESPEIVYGRATRDTIEIALSAIASQMDDDDLFIFHIEWHGTGYLGYVDDSPDNVAYHGFVYHEPLISQAGDERDYVESEFELSLLCAAGGLKDGRDFHYGLDEWGVLWYPSALMVRYKAFSHFSEIYVESHGVVSDDDVMIEHFTDYLLGDFDQDGHIETQEGEVWDWDDDGNMPWDRETGVFDEDDWGPLDQFADDCSYECWHCSLGGIPFAVFDEGLDNRMDIDLRPDGELEVDGTDADNNGCIDGMDLNEDGDQTDWVTVNETMSIYDGYFLWDDEIRAYMEWLPYGTKVIVTNTCFGGGFVNDLSNDRTIIITGSREICRASAGCVTELLNEAFGIYQGEADVDGNGAVSFVEAFNHASIHPHVSMPPHTDRFQYDDNADYVSHEDPLPNGGDGYFGADVYLIEGSSRVREEDWFGGHYVIEIQPNPGGSRVTISFQTQASRDVAVRIYDVGGRLVVSLLDGAARIGEHELVWTGNDRFGRKVPPGVYLVRLQSGQSVSERKVTVVR